MRWLALHLPMLGLEIFSADSPGAQVLIDKGRVVLLNTAATDAGIVAGSSLATAYSIAPSLRHFEQDSLREQQRLAFVAETSTRFSNRVTVQAPGSIVLETGASLRLFQCETRLIRSARELCDELGHQVHTGSGATPLAALAHARHRASRRLGKAAAFPDMASDIAPDLAAIPLSCCELTPAQREQFDSMGIDRLGQLLALPHDELGIRFGSELLDYLQRLTGQKDDPRNYVTPKDRFLGSLNLLEPVTSKQALAFPMRRLLADLQHWLVSRQLAAETLTWHFANRTHAGHRCTIRLARPQQNARNLLGLSQLKLDDVELPEDILDIELAVAQPVPLKAASNDFFLSHAHTAADPSELLDQLRARLGESACCGITPHNRHAPEQAWRATRARLNARQTQPVMPPSRNRPMWLLPAPCPVERNQFQLLRGPERLGSHWWQNPAPEGSAECLANAPCSHARDYYVAMHQRGAQCWIFQNHEQRWFLHGYFG